MENRCLYKAKTTPKEKGEFNNVWVIGNLIVSNGKYYIHPVGNVVNVRNEICKMIVMHEVIPDTICQRTGLKDKKGNMIWENDIVNATDVHSVCVDGIVVNVTDYNLMLNLYYADELECVGNIFDNPELLEGE